MKHFIVSLSSILVASTLTLSAANLLSQAKDSGLVPLPKDQAGIEAMLKEYGEIGRAHV